MTDNILDYTFNPGDKYIYLREVLISHMQLSHSLLSKLKLQQKIRVNGQITFTNYKLQPGDQVTVNLDLEENNCIEPQYIPLDIVFEDEDFLLINKPPGMAVHPVKHIPDGTLANAVSYYWMQRGKFNLFRPINRLDKDTSGLILIGQSQYAHQAIFRQMKTGTIKRHYQALVEGVIQADKGCVDLPIARLNPRSCERTVDSSGKDALTNYTVLKRYEGYTLLLLTLGTGRTHQIRVHLCQLGYPICGDTRYGNSSPLINRQALHAGQLFFKHPRTDTTMNFEVQLPLDIVRLLENLKPLG